MDRGVAELKQQRIAQAPGGLTDTSVAGNSPGTGGLIEELRNSKLRKETSQMHFRHEWKFEISESDLYALRQRLRAVARPDSHAVNGKYRIRSLYFDNLSDQALREKLDGVNRREKYRIRYYNEDISVIHLEKKSKVNGLCQKQSACLSVEEAQWIADGRVGWMADCGRELVTEFYSKMCAQGLRAKVIVDYTREPFVYGPGNVRVTLDYQIRTGTACRNFLNPGCVTIPAGEETAVLEVKWDGFLPSVIQDIIQLPGCRAGSFSKYARCRMYG